MKVLQCKRGAAVALTLGCQYFFTSSHNMQPTAFSQPNTGSTRGGGPTMGTGVLRFLYPVTRYMLLEYYSLWELVLVCVDVGVKRTMYHYKVDVDMLNVNILFMVFSISTSTLCWYILCCTCFCLELDMFQYHYGWGNLSQYPLALSYAIFLTIYKFLIAVRYFL